MGKYVLKRILLMVLTFFVIVTICFILIRLLPQEMPQDADLAQLIEARWEALGYNKPMIVQYGIYLKNIFTKFDFGTSWYIARLVPVTEILASRLAPTILVNIYSLLFSIPLGIGLGILAATKKNKWQDHVISIVVILFVSIPSYIYAFIVQYVLAFELNWFPAVIPSLDEAGGWFTWTMFIGMIPAVLALSFGEIAGLCRFTRAELTETITSDYMLLARAKGLTKTQATTRHALKNAMVPILPMIISSFIGILGGSMVIEQIFSIPGVGSLFIQSINLLDYDVFMLNSIFYVFVGLLAGIVVDLSYGFIDPRIRIGEK
ncbi:MAG: ABC transporter permease [Anaeroplasmataceae bacterium]